MSGHIYELGQQKTTGASAGPVVTLIPLALTIGVQPAHLLEMGIFNVSGVAAEIGLGTPLAAGTGGQATGATVQPVAGWLNAGDTTVALTFTTLQPTAPANFQRRAELQAVVGAGIIWTWDEGEFPLWQGGAQSGQVVLWQVSSLAVTYDVYVKVSE
jgi:hypothetical protein